LLRPKVSLKPRSTSLGDPLEGKALTAGFDLNILTHIQSSVILAFDPECVLLILVSLPLGSPRNRRPCLSNFGTAILSILSGKNEQRGLQNCEQSLTGFQQLWGCFNQLGILK